MEEREKERERKEKTKGVRLEVVCGLKWILIMMKKKKKIWNKKSFFFQLEYWKHLVLRQNLDVMHIEKNVCNNIIGTLLNIPRKTKLIVFRTEIKITNIFQT